MLIDMIETNSSYRSCWLFDLTTLMRGANTRFRSWYRNLAFHHHIQKVQAVLDTINISSDPASAIVSAYHDCFSELAVTPSGASKPAITFNQLFARNPPTISNVVLGPHGPSQDAEHSLLTDTAQLKSVFLEFRHSVNKFHRRYGDDLDKSRESLENQTSSVLAHNSTPSTSAMDTLVRHANRCKENMQDILEAIQQALSPSNDLEEMLFVAGSWPCTTSTTILRALTFGSTTPLTSQWKRTLITLARALLALQRSRRLIKFYHEHRGDEFAKESLNDIDAMSDEDYTDWLLIQVNNQFHPFLPIRYSSKFLED